MHGFLVNRFNGSHSAKFREPQCALRDPCFWARTTSWALTAFLVLPFAPSSFLQFNGQAQGPGQAQAAEVDDSVARKLKTALIESEPRLGELEPWQKKLFDEEAIPQFQRFIRDYRRAQTHSGTANSGLSVDVDIDSLKSYLRFYGPKSLNAAPAGERADSAVKEIPFLVYAHSTEDCGTKCVSSGPGLRKLIAARLLRRGLKPMWLTERDLGPGKDFQGKVLHEKIAALVSSRAAAGALVVEWGKAPAEDEAHADEVNYFIQTWMDVRGLGEQPFKNEGRIELMDSDRFEASFAKLATDAFTDLGARVALAEKSSGRKGESDESAVGVSLLGVRDFAQVSAFKTALQEKFPTASVQERRLSRGNVTLVVAGEGSPEKVNKAIKELRAGNKDFPSKIEVESDKAASSDVPSPSQSEVVE